jgi:hypothetical protein
MRHVQPFQELFAQATPSDQYSVGIPEELLKAWLHFVMSLVYCAEDSTIWLEQINKASSLIDKGMKIIVQNLNQKSVLDKSVLMPFEVALLVNLQLLQDITVAHPDITDSYKVYLSYLVRRPPKSNPSLPTNLRPGG